MMSCRAPTRALRPTQTATNAHTCRAPATAALVAVFALGQALDLGVCGSEWWQKRYLAKLRKLALGIDRINSRV
jgi:hypothetical protein